MTKNLNRDSNRCDVIEVLESARETEENYEFLRIASIPAHIRNWYLTNTTRNMYVNTRLLDRPTREKRALHYYYYYYYYFILYCSVVWIVETNKWYLFKINTNITSIKLRHIDR